MRPSTEVKNKRIQEIRRDLIGCSDPYEIAAEAIELSERYKQELNILRRACK